ncbi:MAG TPA: TIGR02266 family protein [Polyangiaceae bacterium]
MSSGFVFRDESLPVPGGERRTDARVPLETDVTLESDSQFFTGLTGNLSTGGVFVATYRQLPIGCGVVMTLTLPDGELRVKGTVRWSRDTSSGASPGVGVAFDELAPGDTARIARFCELRAPLLHDAE